MHVTRVSYKRARLGGLAWIQKNLLLFNLFFLLCNSNTQTMKISSTSLTSFFFLLTILLPLIESSDTSQNDQISETCKKTLHYQLCVSTLQSDPQSSKALSTQDLSLIAIEAAKAKAIKILKEIKKIMDSNEKQKEKKYYIEMLSFVYKRSLYIGIEKTWIRK